MIELTIPSNSLDAINKVKARKLSKPNYISLIGDLEAKGLSVSYKTLEIGSLGHYKTDTLSCISLSFQLSKAKARSLLQKAAKVTISCSYHIFNSRTATSWDTSKPFYHIWLIHIYFFPPLLICIMYLLPCQVPYTARSTFVLDHFLFSLHFSITLFALSVHNPPLQHQHLPQDFLKPVLTSRSVSKNHYCPFHWWSLCKHWIGLTSPKKHTLATIMCYYTAPNSCIYIYIYI